MTIPSENKIINTESFAQQVYNYLRSAILCGDYTGGEIISAKGISAELGVSMMPVREALKRLEQSGLIEIRPRSVCLVKSPSRQTILSAIHMRELLELDCIKQVYKTVKQEDLKALIDCCREMRNILETKPTQTKAFIFCDWKFHCLLCDLANNEFISSFYPELYIKVNMANMYNMSAESIDYEKFVEDHESIVKALSENSYEAVNILESHIGRSKHSILNGPMFNGSNELAV